MYNGWLLYRDTNSSPKDALNGGCGRAIPSPRPATRRVTATNARPLALAPFTERRVPLDAGVMAELTSVAENHIRPDVSQCSYFHVATKFGPGLNDCRRMDVN